MKQMIITASLGDAFRGATCEWPEQGHVIGRSLLWRTGSRGSLSVWRNSRAADFSWHSLVLHDKTLRQYVCVALWPGSCQLLLKSLIGRDHFCHTRSSVQTMTGKYNHLWQWPWVPDIPTFSHWVFKHAGPPTHYFHIGKCPSTPILKNQLLPDLSLRPPSIYL